MRCGKQARWKERCTQETRQLATLGVRLGDGFAEKVRRVDVLLDDGLSHFHILFKNAEQHLFGAVPGSADS